MAPIPVWSGNLRLSLVLVPVKLYPAVSTEEKVAFRMIHAPSGKPIKYQKGIRDGDTFTEVPEGEIIKGYEHAKGQHVLIQPAELDELKLEAKHTIDMASFVDRDAIDTRYFEKPYYLMPDGDSANEGYTVLSAALAKTGKVAIGQVVMQGREHLVGIMAHGKGLVLLILRYANELRDAEPYFEKIKAEPPAEEVKLAGELIESISGRFEPKKMPDDFARAVHELVRAKVERRAPSVEIVPEGKPIPHVINIMAALKESMQAKGRAKVREAVGRRMGKEAPKPIAASRGTRARPATRRTAH